MFLKPAFFMASASPSRQQLQIFIVGSWLQVAIKVSWIQTASLKMHDFDGDGAKDFIIYSPYRRGKTIEVLSPTLKYKRE